MERKNTLTKPLGARFVSAIYYLFCSPSIIAMTICSSRRPPSSSVEASVSQMNTQSIRCLCEGRTEKALKLLRRCLDKVKKHIPRHMVATKDYTTQVFLTEVPIEGAVGSGLYNDQEVSKSFCLYRCALLTSPIKGQNEAEAFGRWIEEQLESGERSYAPPSLTAIEENHLACYQRSTSSQTEETEPEEDEEVYEEPWNMGTWLLFYGIVVYNLGLVLHELGLVEGRTNLLTKARVLYQTGLALAKRMCHSDPEHSDLPSQWLACALHNNLGHLAAFWGDAGRYVMAKRGLQSHCRDSCLPSFFRQSLVQAASANLVRIPVAPAA